MKQAISKLVLAESCPEIVPEKAIEVLLTGITDVTNLNNPLMPQGIAYLYILNNNLLQI